MERFAVKRGLIKSMGGNAGLAKLATTYFDNINVDADGVFTGSYGLLVASKDRTTMLENWRLMSCNSRSRFGCIP